MEKWKVGIINIPLINPIPPDCLKHTTTLFFSFPSHLSSSQLETPLQMDGKHDSPSVLHVLYFFPPPNSSYSMYLQSWVFPSNDRFPCPGYELRIARDFLHFPLHPLSGVCTTPPLNLRTTHFTIKPDTHATRLSCYESRSLPD